MITVVFFASVREQAGTERLDIDRGSVTNVAELIAVLCDSSEDVRTALSRENLLVAVNQTMVDSLHAVNDGDEVAFFPPVTGG